MDNTLELYEYIKDSITSVTDDFKLYDNSEKAITFLKSNKQLETKVKEVGDYQLCLAVDGSMGYTTISIHQKQQREKCGPNIRRIGRASFQLIPYKKNLEYKLVSIEIKDCPFCSEIYDTYARMQTISVTSVHKIVNSVMRVWKLQCHDEFLTKLRNEIAKQKFKLGNIIS